MKPENTKLIIWENPDRDNEEDKADKSKLLAEFVEGFGLEIFSKYTFMPMVVAFGSEEQIKKLTASSEVVVEDNEEYYASNNTPPGHIPNCS